MYMYTFWTLSIFLPAFLINVAVEHEDLLVYATQSNIRLTIYIFACITFANRIVTVALSVVLFRNFGDRYKGLRRILEGGGALRRFEQAKVVAGTTELTALKVKEADKVVVPNPMASTATIRREETTGFGEETVIGVGVQVGNGRAPKQPIRQSRSSMMAARPSTTDEYLGVIDEYLQGHLEDDVDIDALEQEYNTPIESRTDRVARLQQAP